MLVVKRLPISTTNLPIVNHKTCRPLKSLSMEYGDVDLLLRGAYQSAVRAVLPQLLIPKYIRRTGDTLLVGKDTLRLNRNVHVVGFGKAVINMVKPIEDILKIDEKTSHLVSGVLSVPVGLRSSVKDANLLPDKNSPIQIYEGALHNVPDEAAYIAAKRILDLAVCLRPDDLLIVLISGGGSALFPIPMYPFDLAEKQELVKQLSNAGADIVELNTVRKALSAVKGGKLATKTKARIISLILSDVVNSPLDIIASGPTVPNTDNPQKTLNVLRKYNIKIPATVHEVLSNQAKANHKDWSHVTNYIIGDNSTALLGAAQYLKSNQSSGNTTVKIVSSALIGNSAEVGRSLAELGHLVSLGYTGEHIDINTTLLTDLCVEDETEFVEIVNLCVADRVPLCLLFGGETTVRVRGTGHGGRNQEMVLAAAIHLNQVMIVIIKTMLLY